MDYPVPAGVYVLPPHLVDLRPDAQIDQALTQPPPIRDDKNIWFFWHSGFATMHPYTQRNIRSWHRRFSPQGWVVRVLDRREGSPLNVANFLDVKDPETFPQAFIDGKIGGDYAPQHTSDLVRFPLLIKYGGVYADVGLMQIGDLERLWSTTIADPASPYEVVSYQMGTAEERAITNYFLVAARGSAFFTRCHRLFLALWAEDGGKKDTEGMHCSPLLKGIPLLGANDDMSFEEDGRRFDAEEVRKMLSDYITQSQVMTMVMGLVDAEEDWNGPEFVAKHLYAIDYMEGSQLINVFTEWKGERAFELMSLQVPSEGEEETADQKLAREIVEACLSRSFGFKLAHGLILRVIGETLGSMWRRHTDSDNVDGTYAQWLRYGITYWNQEGVPPTVKFGVIPPFKTGSLLKGS